MPATRVAGIYAMSALGMRFAPSLRLEALESIKGMCMLARAAGVPFAGGIQEVVKPRVASLHPCYVGPNACQGSTGTGVLSRGQGVAWRFGGRREFARRHRASKMGWRTFGV